MVSIIVTICLCVYVFLVITLGRRAPFGMPGPLRQGLAEDVAVDGGQPLVAVIVAEGLLRVVDQGATLVVAARRAQAERLPVGVCAVLGP